MSHRKNSNVKGLELFLREMSRLTVSVLRGDIDPAQGIAAIRGVLDNPSVISIPPGKTRETSLACVKEFSQFVPLHGWEVFNALAPFYDKDFPRLLDHDTINQKGKRLIWQGTEPSIRPVSPPEMLAIMADELWTPISEILGVKVGEELPAHWWKNTVISKLRDECAHKITQKLLLDDKLRHVITTLVRDLVASLVFCYYERDYRHAVMIEDTIVAVASGNIPLGYDTKHRLLVLCAGPA